MATRLLKTWIGDFVKFQIEGYLLDPPPRQQNKEVLAKLADSWRLRTCGLQQSYTIERQQQVQSFFRH
jgi:hypothetical protein